MTFAIDETCDSGHIFVILTYNKEFIVLQNAEGKTLAACDLTAMQKKSQEFDKYLEDRRAFNNKKQSGKYNDYYLNKAEKELDQRSEEILAATTQAYHLSAIHTTAFFTSDVDAKGEMNYWHILTEKQIERLFEND